MDEGLAIGVDFGTDLSRVGVCYKGKFKIFKEHEKDVANLPNLSCVEGSGKANDSGRLGEKIFQGIRSIKRFLGRSFSDEEFQADKDVSHSCLSAGDLPSPLAEKQGRFKAISAEAVTSTVLQSVKKTVELALNKVVSHVVISVPSCFNHSQRAAMIHCGTLSGFTKVKLINSTTAASLPLTLMDHKEKQRYCVIIDFGASVFEVAIVKIYRKKQAQVKAIVSNPQLGGYEFDNKVVHYLYTELKNKEELSSKRNLGTVLRVAATQVKEQLSTKECATVTITMPSGVRRDITLTRLSFEKLTENLFKMIVQSIDKAFKESLIRISDIEDVYVLGGSSEMPKVKQIIGELFRGKEIVRPKRYDEIVVHGAALEAGLGLAPTKNLIPLTLRMTEISSHTLWMVSGGIEELIISQNTKLPHEITFIVPFTSEDLRYTLIDVYEGSDSRNQKYKLLCRYCIKSIMRRCVQDTRIELTFSVSSDEVIKVSAVDTFARTPCFVVTQDIKDRTCTGQTKDFIEDIQRKRVLNVVEKRGKITQRIINYLNNSLHVIKCCGQNALTDDEKQVVLDIFFSQMGDIDRGKVSSQTAADHAFRALSDKLEPILSKGRRNNCENCMSKK